MPVDRIYRCIKCGKVSFDKDSADEHKSVCNSEYIIIGSFGRAIKW